MVVISLRSLLLTVWTSLVLATPVGAVDYIRLSPSEFSQDLQTASRLLAEMDYPAAIDILRILVADEPDDADALALMGYALRKSGDPARAEGFYKRALTAVPNHLGALQYLGELYVEQGQLGLAETQLRLLEAACAGSCEGLAALAQALDAAR